MAVTSYAQLPDEPLLFRHHQQQQQQLGGGGTTGRPLSTAGNNHGGLGGGLGRRNSKRAIFRKALGKLATPRRSLDERKSTLASTTMLEEAERIADIEAFLESGRNGPRSPTGSTSSRDCASPDRDEF